MTGPKSEGPRAPSQLNALNCISKGEPGNEYGRAGLGYP